MLRLLRLTLRFVACADTRPFLLTLCAQIAYATATEDTGAVIVADMLSGWMKYYFNSSENLAFGNSRSSVAFDKEGCTSTVDG